jgi:hypothetical protein
VKCRWCGADLWDYGDVGPLHGKDGRSVNACELIQLRALRNDIAALRDKDGAVTVGGALHAAIDRARNLSREGDAPTK